MPAPSETVQLSSAFARLRWHYEHRHAYALEQHGNGKAIIGVTSNTVPRELIEAADMIPLLLSPETRADHDDLPSAEFMESAFDARTRSIFDFLVSGDGAFLSSVIIPRTSESEHKLFLYLREVQRQDLRADLHVYLYNLLHTRSEEARSYSWERTLELKRHLEKITSKNASSEALRLAIRANNQARDAARELSDLRRGPNAKLSGTEAFEILGARYFMDPQEFARIGNEVVQEIAKREPLQGPRILIKGFPLNHPYLHREIESHGALVFAEDDWWGSRSATRDISTEGDPLESIFEHYYSHEVSPRVLPLETADQWFRETAQSADGVVFHLPPDDDVIGWDYPRHHKYLDELGIPHLLIRVDVKSLATPAPHVLSAFHQEDEQALLIERTRENIAEFIGKLV